LESKAKQREFICKALVDLFMSSCLYVGRYKQGKRLSVRQLLLRCGGRFRVEPAPLSAAGGAARDPTFVLADPEFRSRSGQLDFFDPPPAGMANVGTVGGAGRLPEDTVDGIWGTAGAMGAIGAGGGDADDGVADLAGGPVGEDAKAEQGGEVLGEACELAVGDERYEQSVKEGLDLIGQVRASY
jgi:hypothetical protein